jgi:mannose-1-phosphate guanylyltransferase
MPHVYAVVMAGGAGTRFWPASRALRPKQLLPLAGPEPLLTATVRRIASRVPAERVYVATGAHLLEQTAAALPAVPRANLLAEPVPRNTAPCIAWASAVIARTDPEAVVCVFPSDHHVTDEPAFLAVVDRAIAGAERGAIVTVGIVPSRAETGYGYVEVGGEIEHGLYRVERFVEKPDRPRAETYLAANAHGPKFLWNAGMFFFRAHLMLDAVRTHLPDLAEGLRTIDEAAQRGEEAKALADIFPTLPSVSIDYGVMEKEGNVAVVPGDFGWNDLGSWQSAWELAEKDAAGNALPADAVAIEAHGNLVVSLATGKKKVWALAHVEDLVIVETDDAVLVLPRERAQEVRAVVEALKARGGGLL